MGKPRPGWTSSVPHGNGLRPELTQAGLRNHFVYRLYNDRGDLLYVGCTRRPEARWKEHCKGDYRRMVAQVAKKCMSGPYDYPTARRIEREMQSALRPKFGGISTTYQPRQAAVA